MRESTATTTRRSPVRKTDRAAPPGGRPGRPEQQEFATRGATALAPAVVPVPDGAPREKGRGALRVAPPVPVSAPKAPFVALVLVVVVTGVLGILVLNTKINENAFRLSHLQDQQNNLDEQEQQLNRQLADDSTPTNLGALAKLQGMVNAGQPAYLTLPNGQVIGVPQPASGVPSVTSQQTAQAAAQATPSGAAGH